MPKSRKQNIKISIKNSAPNFLLNLKRGEVGTDGENLYVGQGDRVIPIAPPLGSIVFWNRHGFGTTENGSPSFISLKLPRGWKIANGDRIENSDSPYYGYYLPNLLDDIFFQGSSIGVIGAMGGTNDSSHKHNIAHHHDLSAGASIASGGVHQHGYYEASVIGYSAIEQGGSRATNPSNYGTTGTTDPAGSHTHNIDSIPIGDIASGLYIDGSNHMNQGNARTYDDTQDFTENRPRYLSGIFIIRVL